MGRWAELKASRHVFLVGFMGSGKTTAGRELARRRGWEFIDLDQTIEQTAARTIDAIFREQGEAAFRQHETAALQNLLHSKESQGFQVIALGGGAFVQPANRTLIDSVRAEVIFLDAPVDELLRRCRAQSEVVRPLLQNESRFRRLYDERRPHYQTARIKIDTHQRTVNDVVDEIEQSLELGRRMHAR